MIKKELHFVWITKDDKRFLDKSKAVEHEESIQPNIVEQWLNKLKGERKNED